MNEDNTFTCVLCKGTYEKGWTDEEAEAELKTTFNEPIENCDMVCDDCYKRMGFDQ